MKKVTIKKLKSELWELCKQITRKLHGNKCYTCGRYCEAPHTGHFIASSVCSTELRYSLDNLRPQCFRCNIHLSGNWPAYEKHLEIDKGEDFIKNLKKKNEETKGAQYDTLWYTAQIKAKKDLLEQLSTPEFDYKTIVR